ncbi:RimK family alpha-L-glutamate ligase [Nocardia sp. NPDC088792]|uniref:ATP-grasp domain-containing protein n=1 Tax=Nocardia sp. NPDC088792 TaxID=3364332 RepID=UPI003823AC08
MSGDATAVEPDVWLLFGSGYGRHSNPGSEELARAFEQRFGNRCRIVDSRRLLLGVRAGRLVLEDLERRPVSPPRVVYSRLSTTRLSADREVTLLRQLELMGAVLLNGIEAITAGVNKFWQLQQLAIADLPVMDTFTYADAALKHVVAVDIPHPCVVKSVRGNGGKNVFLAHDPALLRDIHGSLDEDSPYLFQEYLEYSHGRDLRVVVVDGRAVGAYERWSADGGLTANHSRGGSYRVCLGAHPEAEELAVRAAAALAMQVAGVDLLYRPAGGFAICEVNPHPALRAFLGGLAPAIVDACAARLT